MCELQSIPLAAQYSSIFRSNRKENCIRLALIMEFTKEGEKYVHIDIKSASNSITCQCGMQRDGYTRAYVNHGIYNCTTEWKSFDLSTCKNAQIRCKWFIYLSYGQRAMSSHNIKLKMKAHTLKWLKGFVYSAHEPWYHFNEMNLFSNKQTFGSYPFRENVPLIFVPFWNEQREIKTYRAEDFWWKFLHRHLNPFIYRPTFIYVRLLYKYFAWINIIL